MDLLAPHLWDISTKDTTDRYTELSDAAIDTALELMNKYLK
jgi:hypothetical protein